MSKQSPKDRYENDAQYKKLCDTIESLIHSAHFTPSEVRECAVMASIHYEMRHGFNNYLQSIPSQVNDAFKTLSEYRKHGDYSPEAQENKKNSFKDKVNTDGV